MAKVKATLEAIEALAADTITSASQRLSEAFPDMSYRISTRTYTTQLYIEVVGSDGWETLVSSGPMCLQDAKEAKVVLARFEKAVAVFIRTSRTDLENFLADHAEIVNE